MRTIDILIENPGPVIAFMLIGTFCLLSIIEMFLYYRKK